MATSSRRRADQGTDSTSTQAASTTASVTRRSRRPGVIPPVPRKKRWRHWLYAATLLVAGSAGSAQAETFTVTNNNDSGAGSLRQAMLDAAANADASNTINFAASLSGGDTITLASPLPNIGKNLTIDGAANSSLAISGDGQFRPFFVDTGTVSIKSLTIQNGTAQGGNGGSGYSGGGGGLGAGGAIFVNSGAAVTVQGVAFASNTARGGNGGIRDTGLGAAGGGGGSIFGTNGGNSSSSNDGGNGAGPTGGAGGATGGNNGGDGGFGSGGGGGGFLFGTPPDKGGDGGDGGFGGGGGGAGGLVGSATNNTAIGGTGGFGAGNGGWPYVNGGGGSAYGGAIFVRSGGSLTIVDSGISGGSTVAGTGSTAGAAAGTGLFLNDVSVNYTVTTGNTVTVSDTIAGTGGLVKDGDGKLTISGANTYTGGTSLNAGILALSGYPASIGTGSLIANGGSLEVDRNTGSGLANDITLQQNLTINQVQNYNLTLSGDISESGGSYGLNTSGAGIIILDGNNTFTGDVNIGNRSLYISSNAALAQGNNVNIASGSELVTTNSDAIIGELTGPGRIYFLGGSVTAGNANDFTYDGSLEGPGDFIKDGTGTMTLGKNGSVFQNNGLVTISDGAISGNTAQFDNHNIVNNAELIFEQTTDGTYSGFMYGSGDVVKNGAGKLTITDSNNYSGNTYLNAGTIQFSGGSAQIGSGTLIANGGSLEVNHGGDLNLNNAITLQQDLTFNQVQDGELYLFGNISESGGSFGLTTTGAGTTFLYGSNTFTGDVSIQNKALYFGSTSALTQGNNVDIASGSDLVTGGTNAVVGKLTGAGRVHFLGGSVTAGNTDDFTYNGNFEGDGDFVKDGTGTMTLGKEGAVFQNDGLVTISDGAISGNATQFNNHYIVNNAELIFEQTTDGSYSGVISGSGDVVKNGDGVLTITGNSTYTGDTLLNEGTLELSGASGGIGTGDLIANGGILRFAGDGGGGQILGNDITLNADLTVQQFGSNPGGSNAFLSGDISGAGKLTFEKPGGDNGVAFWLSGDNSNFTGDVEIKDGWLVVNTSNSLNQQNNVQTADGTALALYNNSQSIIGDLTGEGEVFLQGDSQITVGTSNDAVFDGRFTGSGDFIKSGSGSLTLTGSNVWGGHALVHTGTTTISDGSLIGSAAAFYNQNMTNNATVIFEQTTDGSYSGVISGSGDVVKNGAGKLTISGANTYTGDTTLNAGVIALDGATADIGTGSLIAEGGSLEFVSGNNNFSNNIVLNQNLTIVAEPAGFTSINGEISGSGDLTFNGGGTIYLDGSNTFTGDLNIDLGGSNYLFVRGANSLVNGNNVNVASGSGLGVEANAIVGDLTGGGYVALYNSTLTAGSTNDFEFDGVVRGTGSFIKVGSGDMKLNYGADLFGADVDVTVSEGSLTGNATQLNSHDITNNATVVFDQVDDGTYSGVMSGSGELVKEGTGRLILEGANTYSGGTTVTAGVLEGTTNSLQGDILNNAEVEFNQAIGGNYAGVMSGTGELTKSGEGTLAVSNDNTYSGDTNLNEGILALNAGGSLGTGTIQANGGTLQFNDFNQPLVNDINLTEDLTVNQIQYGNPYLQGDLSGSGKLSTTGAGVLWLSGDNSGFTGDVDVQNFMLILTDDNSLNQGNNVNIGENSELTTYSGSHAIIGDLTGSGSINLNYAGKVTVGTSNDVTFDGQIFDTGTFIKTGSGSLTLTADEALNHTGTTQVDEGTLIGTAAAFNDHDITNNAAVAFDQAVDGTYAGIMSGTGSLTKDGAGVLTLDAANTYSGGTTINEGTLRLGSNGSLASTTSLSLSPDTVFDVNGQTQEIASLTGNGSVLLGSGQLTSNTSTDTTYGGVISGTGSFIKTGTGALTLTGTNTYSGGTSINGGRLNVSRDNNLGDASGGLSFDGGTLGITGLVVTERDVFLGSSGGTVDVTNGIFGLMGDISGSGDLTQNGLGAMVLGGTNTFTGDVNVNGGLLGISNDGNLGDTANELNLNQGMLVTIEGITSSRTVNITTSGAIDTNGADSTFSGPITGSGLFEKLGNGRLNLTGDSTFSGDTVVSQGDLAINGTWAGGILVDGGTLSGAGTIGGSVVNEGVVGPGNSIDTLTINQDYTQTSAGRLDIEIAPGAEHTDVLNVVGEANLAGELNVTGQGLTGFTIGDRYTFLYGSNGVNGVFETVTDDLAFLDVRLDYSNPYAVSFLLANSATFASAASTPNQFQVGTALDNAAPGATGDFANLISQITLLTTPEAQAAYNNLSGEIYASNSAASIEQAQSLLRNMAERLRQGGGGDGSLLAVRLQTPDQAFQMVSTGDFNRQDDIIRLAHSQTVGDQTSSQVMPQSVAQFLQPVSRAQTWDGWIEGYGQSGRIGSNGNASGIGYSFGATNFGVGYYLDEVTTVGVLGGYANSTVRGGGSGLDRSEVETGQVGVYGRTSIDHNYLLGVINYGYQNYDTDRIVNVGGVTNTATGDYDAGQIGVLLEAGQNRSLGNFVVQPLVGLQYINVHTGSFTETATGGVGLNVDGQSDNSLRGSVGGRLLRPMTLRGGRTFVPEMQARYMYEFLDSSQSIGATFAGAAPGAPFAIQGVSAGNSFIVYGAGGSLVLNDSFSLYGHYIGQASDRLTSHTGTGGFQFSW